LILLLINDILLRKYAGLACLQFKFQFVFQAICSVSGLRITEIAKGLSLLIKERKLSLGESRVPKMKTTLRILSAVLALIACASLLASCGDTQNNTPETGSDLPAAQTTVIEETTVYDPFLGLNYANTEFNYLAWEQTAPEYDYEEESGDMIESAIYRRNRYVEDKLGVKLSYSILKGNSSTFQDFCKTATTSINSGSKAWDALACYTRAASLLMMNGVLSDLLTTEYLDFEQPCWPKSLVNLNTIGGCLYFASGDIASSILYQMQFMALNNDLAKDLNITGVQEKALEGGWTLDYMLEITKDVFASTGGNRDYTCTYGYFINGHTYFDTFYLGAGMNYVSVSNDGEASVSEDLNSDKSYDIQDKLRKLLWSGATADGYYCTTSSEVSLMMTGGNCLLYSLDGSKLTTYLTQSDYGYSILCAPKYSEDQENYYTAVGFPHSMYCIPSDAEDKSMSSAVMELMAEKGYSDVSTVIFDTAFKYRYSQGQGDSRMFDIIRSGIVFDLGRILFDQMGGDGSGPVRQWRNACTSANGNFAAAYKGAYKTWKKTLDSSLETIKSHAQK